MPRLQRAQPHDECRQRLPCARHAALCDPLSKRVGGAWHPGRALLRRYHMHAQEGDLNLTENILNILNKVVFPGSPRRVGVIPGDIRERRGDDGLLGRKPKRTETNRLEREFFGPTFRFQSKNITSTRDRLTHSSDRRHRYTFTFTRVHAPPNMRPYTLHHGPFI